MNTGKKLFLCAGLLAFFLSVSAQSYSLRTNVIGLATTNLNLEASMTLNRKWSLHLPVQYNPFKFGRNRQFRNFYAAPGVRYWLLESYMGGFIGMYGTAGTYSVGNLFGNKLYCCEIIQLSRNSYRMENRKTIFSNRSEDTDTLKELTTVK